MDTEGLFQKLGIPMKLTGPVLEEEGMHVFEWWGGEYRSLDALTAEMDAIEEREIDGFAWSKHRRYWKL